MSEQLINRPEPTEYAAYYEKYISRVADGNIVTVLGQQIDKSVTLLNGLSDAQAGFRYAPEKWSVKEVVGHLIARCDSRATIKRRSPGSSRTTTWKRLRSTIKV